MKMLLPLTAILLSTTTLAQSPRIDSISPDCGITLGGTRVTIRGADFGGATGVRVGGLPLLNFELIDESTIEGNTPGGSGPVAVTLLSPLGNVTVSAGFVYRVGQPAAGSALSFGGAEVVDLSAFDGLPAGSDHTIEAWVWTDPATPTVGGGVVEFPHYPDFCSQGVFVSKSGGTFCYDLNPSGCGNSSVVCDPAQTSGWTHVAAVHAGNQQLLYVNGRLAAQRTQSGSVGVYNHLMVGANGLTTYSSFFTGVVDELRIWSRARTVGEIADTMFRPLRGSEPGLSLYWRLDEGSGSTLDDSSGNGWGVAFGGPAWVSSGAPLFSGTTPPDVDAVDVSLAYESPSLTVQGEGFDSSTTVRVNGVANPVLAQDPSSVTFQASPALPGAATLTVSNACGSRTVPAAVKRLPVLEGTSTGIGGSLLLRLENGGPGFYYLAHSLGTLGSPFRFAGAWYGLTLDPSQAAAFRVFSFGTVVFDPTQVSFPIPNLAFLSGQTIHIQALSTQGQSGSSFSNRLSFPL